jgi:hypothetical protein
MTDGTVRVLLLVVAILEAIGAALLMLQVPWVVALPPFAGRTAMSNTFLASFLFASAAATCWCLYVRSDRGFAGIGLDTQLIFGSIAMVLLVGAVDGGGSAALVLGAASVVVSGFGGLLLRWALRHQWRDPRPTPPSVVTSFAIFVVALLAVGTMLVLRVPNVLPWRVTPDLSTLFGLMFLSASSYYAYGLVDRRWENAGGQLAAFLAYDLVLIVPLAGQLISPGTTAYETGDGSIPVNLVVYVGVILYSGALAVYHLFLSRATRLVIRGRRG